MSAGQHIATPLNAFTLYQFSLDGQLTDQPLPPHSFETGYLTELQQKLSRLSDDLELPLEARVPGEHPFLEFRIGSDGSGAFVLYYLHDEIMLASLFLTGSDDQEELDLIQVFRFLLLDEEDLENPSEQDITEILSSSAFDCQSLDSRPAVISVLFPDQEPPSPEVSHAQIINLHLAATFFARESPA
jgi:hypothetical protein